MKGCFALLAFAAVPSVLAVTMQTDADGNIRIVKRHGRSKAVEAVADESIPAVVQSVTNDDLVKEGTSTGSKLMRAKPGEVASSMQIASNGASIKESPDAGEDKAEVLKSEQDSSWGRRRRRSEPKEAEPTARSDGFIFQALTPILTIPFKLTFDIMAEIPNIVASAVTLNFGGLATSIGTVVMDAIVTPFAMMGVVEYTDSWCACCNKNPLPTECPAPQVVTGEKDTTSAACNTCSDHQDCLDPSAPDPKYCKDCFQVAYDACKEGVKEKGGSLTAEEQEIAVATCLAEVACMFDGVCPSWKCKNCKNKDCSSALLLSNTSQKEPLVKRSEKATRDSASLAQRSKETTRVTNEHSLDSNLDSSTVGKCGG